MASAFLLGPATNIKRQCTYEWRPLCQRITKSRIFTGFIICSICVNALTLGLATNMYSNEKTVSREVFSVLSVLFVMVYTVEFVLKICVEPTKYWKNKYNVFDFVVLLLSYCQCIGELIYKHDPSHDHLKMVKILRVLQTLITLRMVSFRRALQVLNCLYKTLF